MSQAALLAAFTIAFVATSATNADESASPKSFQQVVDFVASNLIGKTLETAVTAKIGDGSIETDFHRRTMYTHLVRTDDTAAFDAIILIRQKLWDLDSNGKRTTDEPRSENRALVIRHSVHASKATGDAIGISLVLTNSLSPSTGQGSGIKMRVKAGELILVQSTAVYFDGYAKGDTYTPTASTETTTFSVANGKLTADTIELGYEVDPKTLERTPSGHQVRLSAAEVPGLF